MTGNGALELACERRKFNRAGRGESNGVHCLHVGAVDE